MVSIWLDVEDLFEYARENPRPSGIQRLAFEIYNALREADGETGRVHFIRHVPLTNSFREIDWAEIAALFSNLTQGHAAVPRTQKDRQNRSPGRPIVRKLVHRLPLDLRLPAIDLLISCRAATAGLGRLLGAIVRRLAMLPRRIGRLRRGQGPAAGQTARAADFAASVAPGDVLMVCGSPWFHPAYDEVIQRHKAKYGMRFALLVYDLIPLRRPEWCDKGLVRLFGDWFTAVLPLCDQVFAISQATAADVALYARERGIMQARETVVIPVGTGVSARPAGQEDIKRPLPAPGTYALIVSTIEARKNHLLLFRIWRRLLEEKPCDQVPALVFAGRVGWLVDDLMQQISNTDQLHGKLVLVDSPNDAELKNLYAGCLFTLFPSFYEGWGLPVTESLGMGKPCLIANRTSLPEAGGALARGFDPDNLNDAYDVVRKTIEDRQALAAWEDQVRREFKPVPWSASAGAILEALGMTGTRPARAPLDCLSHVSS